MALKRKKRDFIGTCSYCKEMKTNYTVHGGYVGGGGRTCCDTCYPALRKKEEELINQDSSLSLGEEMAYRSYGIY